MFRIAVAGSHGVGKSTLCERLQSELKQRGIDVSVISGIARNLIEKGFPLGREATQQSYIHYIVEQLHAERALRGRSFISDRTLLDPLSYAEVNHALHFPGILSDMIDLLRNVWELESEMYDFYVFVPIEFPMTSDGIRPEGQDYQFQIEQQIKAHLQSHQIRYISVKGTLEQRCDQVLSTLRQFL